MQIPFTLNACAIALANLGQHVLIGDERAQTTGSYPVDGMAAFIAVKDEHASIEATFLLPGVVSQESDVLMRSNALQMSALGVCRFVFYEDRVMAKSTMFASESLTAGQVQSWWNTCLREIDTWYREIAEQGFIDVTVPVTIPEQFALNTDIYDVYKDECSPDDEFGPLVTTARVVHSMTQLTGAIPQVRTTNIGEVVEASIGGQKMDIEVIDGALRFIIGSSLQSLPGLGEALAHSINWLSMQAAAPSACIYDYGDHIEMFTRGVVDTSTGLDDGALTTAIKKWGPYVYDFNEQIFNDLQGLQSK